MILHLVRQPWILLRFPADRELQQNRNDCPCLPSPCSEIGSYLSALITAAFRLSGATILGTPPWYSRALRRAYRKSSVFAREHTSKGIIGAGQRGHKGLCLYVFTCFRINIPERVAGKVYRQSKPWLVRQYRANRLLRLKMLCQMKEELRLAISIGIHHPWSSQTICLVT